MLAGDTKSRSRLTALIIFCIALTYIFTFTAAAQNYPQGQDWSNYARIGAWGLTPTNADRIAREAQASGVQGIEVDNDIPGRYESFVDPREKLAAIKSVAEAVHKLGNHAVVYIAGTECITANADQTPHTVFKEHPDWLQRKITGEPAIFGGGTAFWIRKGDEDVWISPYAPAWRKIYMERVRQIAATGIDGIYIDIPYWMTHFEGWENSWASFDDYTVAAFKAKTGLDAKKDLKLGDFSDPNFRQWVTFRIDTITDFLQDIATNAKSVNPHIKIMPEIYPGIEEEAVRVGSDVYSLYPIVDAIAHEYEFGSGHHLATERRPLDWFFYQVGMHSFRAFAQGKPTWILNYSWDGDKNADRRAAMKQLAMSEIMAGANFWDAPGHSMAGSNDLPTRKQIFSWIAKNERTFYMPRTPIDPIGVYFSPSTRNFYVEHFLASYRGILVLLMQKHLEFQVVAPRTLNSFKGNVLVLPDVRILNPEEKQWLSDYTGRGGKLVITGTDATQLSNAANIVRFPNCPGKAYLAGLQPDMSQSDPDSQAAFLKAVDHDRSLEVTAPALTATSIARVDGNPHVFFANFASGGASTRSSKPAQVRIKQSGNTEGYFLPYMGEAQRLQGAEGNDGTVTYTLPEISSGGVFWYSTAQSK